MNEAMRKVVQKRNDLYGATVVANLQKRGFTAYYVPDKEAALAKALKLIPADHTVAWGGSVTIDEIGLLAAVKEKYRTIDREKAQTPEERAELMRRALLCDTFLMSSNAISEDGQLVNIDGNGNRCAALIYGPRQVLLIAGINKVTKDLDSAIKRARQVAATINVQRFAPLPTPCCKTGLCMNCNLPESICNQFVITRRNNHGHIVVVLVGEDLGF